MSDEQPVIEGKSTEVARVEDEQVVPSAPLNLIGTDDPHEAVARYADIASALKEVLVKQKLVKKISGRDYPVVEAWTLLGSMLGVFPVCTWSREVEGGWEARVEARTLSGAVVGAAEAQCLANEKNWKSRDAFALRSMAQTRATAKALRLPLGFIVQLAGFETTPAEEMPGDSPRAEEGGRSPGASPPDSPADKSSGAPSSADGDPATEQRVNVLVKLFKENGIDVEATFAKQREVAGGVLTASWVEGAIERLAPPLAKDAA